MSQSEDGYSVRSLCGFLGITSQGYYKHKGTKDERDILSSSIVLYCQHIRRNGLPKAGCRELYELCRSYFRDKFTIGRDRFYNLLRSNHLMLRRRRYRPRTTDSRHCFRLYTDLVNTSPKFTPVRNGSLVVSDITYIYTREGFAYLSLVTDAYSRYIVGHCLSRTLEAEGPLKAINCALETYRRYNIDINGMIHHSDRGIQYASRQYTDTLLSNNIRISMTQTGDPLHNALAERMNNTLKNGWLFNEGNLSFEEAEQAIAESIEMYNKARPHKSLGMRTPMELLTGECDNPLMDYGDAGRCARRDGCSRPLPHGAPRAMSFSG